MEYHIIMDSVGDQTEGMKQAEDITVIPLTILIDGEVIMDDETLLQEDLLTRIKKSSECPKSACPSPEQYRQIYEKQYPKDIFVITGSTELTGSFGSASVAKQLFLEDHPDAKIAIINSKSGSAGETLLVCKIKKMVEENSYLEIVSKIEAFVEEQQTRFVLEDLTFLQKNGRLTGVKSFLAEKLNIVPILKANEIGQIIQSSQARGVKKALKKLYEDALSDLKENPRKDIVISHCNCFMRAATLRGQFIQEFAGINVHIANTGGIASLYAGNQGIVISY